MNQQMKHGALGLFISLLLSNNSWADDTELFVFDFDDLNAIRPKVLLIFDTSGSMAWDIPTRQLYNQDSDGDFAYTVYSGGSFDDNYLYFTVNGIDDDNYVPTGSADDKKVLVKLNNCASSYKNLAEKGVYTGVFRELRYQSKVGYWSDIRTKSGGADFRVFDCGSDFSLLADADGNLVDEAGASVSTTVQLVNASGSLESTSISTLNPGQYQKNTSKDVFIEAPQGYPIAGGSNKDGTYYSLSKSDAEASTKNAFDSGKLVTLYTANYLRWYHHNNTTIDLPRIDVAKTAVKNAISTIDGVEYGLMMFNPTTGGTNGGRVILGIDADRPQATLFSYIDDLPAKKGTPLVETLSEAQRYLTSSALKYGKANQDGVDSGDSATIKRLVTDTNIVSGDDYLGPFSVSCDDTVNVIYITDGAPTGDDDADSYVKGLAVTDEMAGCESATSLQNCTWGGAFSFSYTNNSGNTVNTSSYLPTLSEWLNKADLDGSVSGRQYAKVSTIGFGEDVIESSSELLKAAAQRGGGTFYTAEDGLQLEEALRQAFIGAYEENSSLVSPAVTGNNFDSTRTLDILYYAMFKPGLKQRWQGNLKKLKVGSDGNMLDSKGKPAIDADGSIIDEAQTYWSSVKDGNSVELGGVAEMLSKANSRTLYFDHGAGLLKALTKSNLSNRAGSEELLADHFSLSSKDEIDAHLDWIRGIDVDDGNIDGSTTDKRLDIMADPLHSRPVAINYGLKSGASPQSTNTDDLDLRVLIGTNGGALHMFRDHGNSVSETWAFMPYELLGNQRTLRENPEGSTHIYGMDSTPAIWREDNNGNGKYYDAGDKVIAIVGMRRGGSGYYALDITKPDLPKLLWHRDSGSSNFGELGQSWSVPNMGYIPGHTNPVMVIGAGYDINQDSTTPASADGKGRGIFIVDIYTGEKVWSLSAAEDTRLTHSVPGKVATLDSDGDGYIDRLYFGDTGGRAWRIDLYSETQAKWKLTALADISDSTDATQKRKFFTEPVVVRTYLKRLTQVTTTQGGETVTITDTQQVPYDAVLIGTGDRTKPVSDEVVLNHFYMFRDYNVQATDWTVDGLTLPVAITPNQLYNITSDPIGSLTDEAQIEQQLVSLGASSGWVYDLLEKGEKSLGTALVLSGDVYFTSFIPTKKDATTCSINSIGTGRTYVVNMHFGTDVYPKRYYDAQNKVPDDLIVYSGEKTETYIDENGDTVEVTESVVRVFGGDSGDEITGYDDGDQNNDHTCEQNGDCSQGSREANMDMSPKQIYTYFEEP